MSSGVVNLPEAARRLQGVRVLIVDDSLSALAFARAALERSGCRVETSSDIWVAELIGSFDPNVVLVDVNLASCPGHTVVRALKRRGRSSAKYVLYSSATEARLRELSELCGADGILQKDEDPERVVRVVEQVLEAA